MTEETLDRALILINRIHDTEAILKAFREERMVTLFVKANPMTNHPEAAELWLKDEELVKDISDVLRKHLHRFKKEFENL